MCNGSWNRFRTLNYIRHLYWSAVHLELLVYSSLPLTPTVNLTDLVFLLGGTGHQ